MTLKFTLNSDLLLSSFSFFGQQSFVFLKVTFLVTSFGELGWEGDIIQSTIQCYKLLRNRQHCLNIKTKGSSLSQWAAQPSDREVALTEGHVSKRCRWMLFSILWGGIWTLLSLSKPGWSQTPAILLPQLPEVLGHRSWSCHLRWRTWSYSFH